MVLLAVITDTVVLILRIDRLVLASWFNCWQEPDVEGISTSFWKHVNCLFSQLSIVFNSSSSVRDIVHHSTRLLIAGQVITNKSAIQSDLQETRGGCRR